MLKAVKELNNRYANENLEVRKLRGSGGIDYSSKSIDLVLPRRFINVMNLSIGDYVTCELQQLPRTRERCLIIKKLDLTGITGEVINA